MRNFKEFSTREWLRLVPLQTAFKQLRNDVWLSFYKRLQPKKLDIFLQEHEALKDRNIALVIAFEQPWALDWMLRMSQRNLTDTTILVFDNSRRSEARKEIERVCRNHATPYLALPANPTRHVNRSHGMAMTWIFYNVVRAIKPRLFAFIDHDMIPVKNLEISERMGGQPFFGLKKSTNERFWTLWAGYCMFDYSTVAGLKMNFLYDFSRGVDTGGRNWNCLYQYHDRATLQFATFRNADVRDPVTGEVQSVQFVDERWLHIGAISYKKEYKSKVQLYDNLALAFDRGMSWSQINDEAVVQVTQNP